MNRTVKRDPNDISNIIGNLPQRLQRKFVEECSSSVVVGNARGQNVNGFKDNVSPKRVLKKSEFLSPDNTSLNDEQENATGCIEHSQHSFDLFLQKNGIAKGKSCNDRVVPVLESSGNSLVNAMPDDVSAPLVNLFKREINHDEVVDKQIIPGILHLKTHVPDNIDMRSRTCQTANGKNGAKKSTTENGRRYPRLEPFGEGDFPLSPIHYVSGLGVNTKAPQWLLDLDAPYAKNLPFLYGRVMELMQDNILTEENWMDYCECRKKLQKIFIQLVMHNLKFCCEQKVDIFFWKLLFYNVREYLKNDKVTEGNIIQTVMLELIKEGQEFYTYLYKKILDKYLSLDQETVRNDKCTSVSERRSQKSVGKYEFIAKVIAQKLLIYLGDLNRYKVQQMQKQDYSEAAKYYQKAQRLIPTNGIPYNQLAIVAIHTKKKFDAIYFHMRSLMSSNPIQTARESLLELFDDIRKKYEETEAKSSPPSFNRKNDLVKKSSSTSMRKEVWIYPDGQRRLHRTDIDDENNNKKLFAEEEIYLEVFSAEELLRRFTSIYLYVIGKLFTGVGMESVHEQQRKVLSHLNSILKRDEHFISHTRLLKIVALNIFVIEQNMKKESRREIRYYAFNCCNQMFGLLLRKCNKLIMEYDDDDPDKFDTISLANLNTLLQFINIYTSWLARNLPIWEPIRSENHVVINCWTEWRQFISLLQKFKTSLKNNLRSEMEIDEPQKKNLLDEEIILLGFTPLQKKGAMQKLTATTTSLNPADQLSLRISKILEFQTLFEKHEMSLEMKKPEQDDEYSHFVSEHLNEDSKFPLGNFSSDSDDNDENVVMNGCNRKRSNSAVELKSKEFSTNQNNQMDVQMIELLQLKNQLKANTNELYKVKYEEILQFAEKLFIEVRPKYLLPDTNCFIDNLDEIEQISKDFNRFQLIVPLTVVRELDGLSKGVKLETLDRSKKKKQIHHYDDVSSCAKKSVDFIKTAKNVKCVTMKGSSINCSLFDLVEEDYISNDDKILGTALALSRTMSTEIKKKGKTLIKTELVLITTDRNLRVKALSRNLAVSELGEFLEWAKVCGYT